MESLDVFSDNNKYKQLGHVHLACFVKDVKVSDAKGSRQWQYNKWAFLWGGRIKLAIEQDF